PPAQAERPQQTDELALASGDFEADKEEEVVSTSEAPAPISAEAEESLAAVPAEEPAVEARPAAAGESQVPAKRQGTGFATMLGFLGFTVAAAALWMNLELTKRVDQLENQLADVQQTQRRPQSIDAQSSAPAGKPSASTHAKTKAKKVTTQPTKPKRPITPATRISTGKTTGNWVVNLDSFTKAKAADAQVRKLRKLGISAEKTQVNSQGKTWYRIRVSGFANADQAKAHGEMLASKHGIKGAWVGQK
ncbi:MAG: SPOR domain-containing protein, partial [Mariprofundaceae bacterium]